MYEVYKEGWITPFVYFNYSELSYIEKVKAAEDACFYFSEDMVRGMYKEDQNSEWYSKLLKLLDELGFETSEVRYIDWDNQEILNKYGRYFYDIAIKLDAIRHSDKYKKAKYHIVTLDRIILD